MKPLLLILLLLPATLSAKTITDYKDQLNDQERNQIAVMFLIMTDANFMKLKEPDYRNMSEKQWKQAHDLYGDWVDMVKGCMLIHANEPKEKQHTLMETGFICIKTLKSEFFKTWK